MLTCSLFAAPVARAQPAEDLMTHGVSLELVREGNQLWAARDYLAAADRYDRAYELERTKVLQLWAARALERGGKWVEAHERYSMVTELPAEATSQDWDAARTARRDATRLEPHIPRLTLRVVGALPNEVQVTVNGELVPADKLGVARWMNPGPIRVAGIPKALRPPLRGPKEQLEALADGEDKTVTLVFTTAPERDGLLGASGHGDENRSVAPETRRVLSYIALGVSGAALLTGSAFGWMALQDHADLRRQCRSQHCPAELGSEVDAFEAKRALGVAGIITGGVLGVTGLALYLSAPQPRATPQRGAASSRSSWHGLFSAQGVSVQGNF